MNYKIQLAKNGEYTLLLNDIYIYSKYNPFLDAEKFIKNEFDREASGYFLIGLGLGYHLEALLKISGDKKVKVLPFNHEELRYFKEFSNQTKILNATNVEVMEPSYLFKEEILDYQIIIPLSWMKAIGNTHRLYDFLEGIKVRQMSFNNLKPLMENNFKKNLLYRDSSISSLKEKALGKFACLISAGPSLERTLGILWKIQSRCFVLCVGSALKVVLGKGIIPDAIIITDPSAGVCEQLRDVGYNGMLFYLSTANHDMTLLHKGKRIILYQKGYSLSEKIAEKYGEELLETGGSVATTGLSLLELMGFQSVILFGQDLGFKENNTHSVKSPSNSSFDDTSNFRQVIANNGEYINTRADFNIFRKWFEQKAANTNITILNTAWNGAKIIGIPFISEQELEEILLLVPDFELNALDTNNCSTNK